MEETGFVTGNILAGVLAGALGVLFILLSRLSPYSPILLPLAIVVGLVRTLLRPEPDEAVRLLTGISAGFFMGAMVAIVIDRPVFVPLMILITAFSFVYSGFAIPSTAVGA